MPPLVLPLRDRLVGKVEAEVNDPWEDELEHRLVLHVGQQPCGGDELFHQPLAHPRRVYQREHLRVAARGRDARRERDELGRGQRRAGVQRLLWVVRERPSELNRRRARVRVRRALVEQRDLRGEARRSEASSQSNSAITSTRYAARPQPRVPATEGAPFDGRSRWCETLVEGAKARWACDGRGVAVGCLPEASEAPVHHGG